MVEREPKTAIHVLAAGEAPAVNVTLPIDPGPRFLLPIVFSGLLAGSMAVTGLALFLAESGIVPWGYALAMAGALHLLTAVAVVLVIGRLSGAVWRERQLARFNRALAQEIDERKRVEAALREANQEAMRANRTKSEFLANVSHELRTPLNAILGFSDILRRGLFGPLGNERYQDYAKDIHQSGRHLLDLINDILDIAKIEARKADLHETDFELEQVARSCLRMVAQQADAHGLDVVLEIDPEIPRLHADQRAVKQILLNLLTNAVKFTPSGGRVILAASTSEDGGLSISVSDTGYGMAPDEISVALEPFGQTLSSRKTEEQGTGLGLTLTKRMVELHGGRFELDSEPGQGTTAFMYFPADRSCTVPSIAQSA